MRSHHHNSLEHAWTIVAVFAVITMSTHSSAQDVLTPNFSPSSDVGWVAYGSDFIPPSSGPGPVRFDPAHPFIPDSFEYRLSEPNRKGPAQQTFRVADLSNPILQPWAREELRKRNELVLSGKPGFTLQVSCWPLGVPASLLYAIVPISFIQMTKEVIVIYWEFGFVRHIYLNVPHSERVKPSWFGESVGHYEGDTLVVDTVGMNDKTYVDNYRTPHSEKLHVVERYQLTEGGKVLEVSVHVEDTGAFTTPWDAIQRYTRVETRPLTESPCAENTANYFGYDIDPIPTVDKSDF